MVAAFNQRRCSGFPLYGQDLIRSVRVTNSLRPVSSAYRGQGYINCLNATQPHLKETRSSSPSLDCYQPAASLPRVEKDDFRYTTRTLPRLLDVAREVVEKDDFRYTTRTLPRLLDVAREDGLPSRLTLKWDEPVLEAKDPRTHSAKLQALDKILLERSNTGEKVVVSTGLLDMVPLLQKYCALHQFRYIVVSCEDTLQDRLNRTDMFNMDPRFFVLIVAGLSSSLGLRLTSVSTVVYLDSGIGEAGGRGQDWACKVEAATPLTIYRLLCRGTVEDSVTRRQTQRRLVKDLKDIEEAGELLKRGGEASEGRGGRMGETILFRKQTIDDLFHPQLNDNGIYWDVFEKDQKKKKDKCGKEELDELDLAEQLSALWAGVGSALPQQQDCLVDLAELDECASWEPQVDWQSIHLSAWKENLDPVTRYGIKLVRDCWEARPSLSEMALRIPREENLDTIKMEWETSALDMELVAKNSMDVTEILSFRSELAHREWKDSLGASDTMWKPPVMGQQEETYSDVNTGLLYCRDLMDDASLPPVHIKKEKKREVVAGIAHPSPLSPPAPGHGLSPVDTKPKIRREEAVITAPRSLFDRPRPFKTIGRVRPGGVPVPIGTPVGTLPQVGIKPVVREPDVGPDWLIQEDWALHQAVLELQGLPLNLAMPQPGHTVNWDMVADMVNAVSRTYRSFKQCRARYDQAVVPREEGRLLYDVTANSKKQKKQKGNLKQEKKTVISRPMKTSALYRQDNNGSWSSLSSGRFEKIKAITNKRTPTSKPLHVNPTVRNPKHAAVLAESGISYETPLSPIQVAANRAERIQREKQRTQQAQELLRTQQQTQVATPTNTVQQVATQATPRVVATVAASTPTITTVHQPTSLATPPQAAQAVVVGISQPLPQQQQTLSQQQPTIVQTNNSLSNMVAQAVARPQQTVTSLTVQDMTRHQTLATVSSPAVVSVAGLIPSNSATRQILVSQAGKTVGSVTATSTGGTLQVAGRQLTPQQLQMLKQQAILKKNLQDQQAQKARLGMPTNMVATNTQKMAMTGAGRGQLVRQNVRSMTEADVKALLAKQQLKIQGGGGVVQVPTSISTAQLLAAGIQVAPSSTTTATLVKTVSASAAGTSKSVTIPLAGVNIQAGQIKAGRGMVGTSQQQQLQQLQLQRQLQLIQRKGGIPQKVALQQVGGGKLPTQLIVQGQQGKSGLPATVTVQQLQQIVKSVASSGSTGQVQLGSMGGQQIISHAVLAKPGAPQGQTVQARVIPVSGTGRPGQQTIQVVAAAPSGSRTAAPNVTIDAMGRPQGGTVSALATALAAGSHVKIAAPGNATQQQIISQVSAALAGQQVSVAVRAPSQAATVTVAGLQPGMGRLATASQQIAGTLQLNAASGLQQHQQQNNSGQE